MSEHKKYAVEADEYRHYKKGDAVLLRDHVAAKLVKDGVVSPVDADKPEIAPEEPAEEAGDASDDDVSKLKVDELDATPEAELDGYPRDGKKADKQAFVKAQRDGGR